MTYILGWKNYNSVFLVGDSVITIDHQNVEGNRKTFRNQTTFGEDHIYQQGKTVSEKWLKLYELENRIAIAISGEIKEAYEGIELLKKAIETQGEIDLKEEIKYAFWGKKVGVIIGFYENGKPILISCYCEKDFPFKEHPSNEVVHSGSISSEFRLQTEDFFSQIETNEWSDDQLLTSIIAVAQSFCFQKSIISQGVGGFFSGIRINEEGVCWQKDLAFIPFAHNGKELKKNQLSEIFGQAKMIVTQVRDSILFSGSSFIEDPKKATRPFSNFQPDEVISNETWYNERLAWAEKWGREIDQNWEERKADYYIFYNTEKPIVAMVYSRKSMPFEISKNSLKLKAEMLEQFQLLFKPNDNDLTIYTSF
jgi:hypothetical protein